MHTCNTCSHWGMFRHRWDDPEDAKKALHFCLRYPPVPIVILDRQMDVQPTTHGRNTCGEWREMHTCNTCGHLT